MMVIRFFVLLAAASLLTVACNERTQEKGEVTEVWTAQGEPQVMIKTSHGLYGQFGGNYLREMNLKRGDCVVVWVFEDTSVMPDRDLARCGEK